jgi:hypothetical protein
LERGEQAILLVDAEVPDVVIVELQLTLRRPSQNRPRRNPMVFHANVDRRNARNDVRRAHVRRVHVLKRAFLQRDGVPVRDVLPEFVRHPCGGLVVAARPEPGVPVGLLLVPVLDEF